MKRKNLILIIQRFDSFVKEEKEVLQEIENNNQSNLPSKGTHKKIRVTINNFSFLSSFLQISMNTSRMSCCHDLITF